MLPANSVSIQRVWTRKSSVGATKAGVIDDGPVERDDRRHAVDDELRERAP